MPELTSEWIMLGGAIGWAAVLCASPFMLWRSFLTIVRGTLFTKHVSLAARLSLSVHLAKELVFVPVLTILWWIDELVFPGYRKSSVSEPVFIMSQPRSGTTLLLRTLATDKHRFFSLTHLEWRLPSIALWSVLDALRMRNRLEQISYWPNTEIGRLASKLHAHVLGDVEEHGIFLEERMYHHYFSFRRFPFPEVLRRVGTIDQLTEGEQRKLLSTFSAVVRKAAYYRGKGRIWLTKENESVEFYRLLVRSFPGARFLVIRRSPNAFLPSYVKMSQVCTIAKHGVDPERIEGWRDANMQFRRTEALKQVELCRELEKRQAVAYINFEDFTRDIHGTVRALYAWLGISLKVSHGDWLLRQQRQQDSRESGYSNDVCEVSGFERYSEFMASTIALNQHTARRDEQRTV
jgi:omega-hydroxy-beta-dihydromenaquinone-9 sulfotransferase